MPTGNIARAAYAKRSMEKDGRIISVLKLTRHAMPANAEPAEAGARERGPEPMPERVWVEAARELAVDGSLPIVDLSVVDGPDGDSDHPYQERAEYVLLAALARQADGETAKLVKEAMTAATGFWRDKVSLDAVEQAETALLAHVAALAARHREELAEAEHQVLKALESAQQEKRRSRRTR